MYRWLLIVLIWLLFASPLCAQTAGVTSPYGESIVDDFDAEFADESWDDDAPLISDPFESFNRGIFWFNDKAYSYLLKPVARAFRVVPRPVHKSVKNFFANLRSPVRIINSTLQFKFADAGRETTRLLVNSTLGVAGLIDAAAKWGGIPQKDEDFGQTLGVYHLGQGPYLVLPFLGPSSLRDSGGLVVDTLLDPLTYVTWNWSLSENAGLRAGMAVNVLALDDDSYEKIKRDALDPYLFMRAAYAQYRVAKVAQ